MRAINIWKVAKNQFWNYKSNIGLDNFHCQKAVLYYNLLDFFFSLVIKEIFEEKYYMKYSLT